MLFSHCVLRPIGTQNLIIIDLRILYGKIVLHWVACIIFDIERMMLQKYSQIAGMLQRDSQFKINNYCIFVFYVNFVSLLCGLWSHALAMSHISERRFKLSVLLLTGTIKMKKYIVP